MLQYALHPPAVIIVQKDMTLSYPSLVPSTRFPTGTVLVLLTPVRLDRSIATVKIRLFRTARVCHHTSHPPGPEYPVTLERKGETTVAGPSAFCKGSIQAVWLQTWRS